MNLYKNSAFPTIAPKAGNYGNPRCLGDSLLQRVLEAGSEVNHNTDGMAAQKCADSADGWRFSGVEYKG